MVNEQIIFQEIHKLSDNLKEKVFNYVQNLQKENPSEVETPKPRKKRKAGSAKGMFVMTDAFDEPLEDFAEYM